MSTAQNFSSDSPRTLVYPFICISSRDNKFEIGLRFVFWHCKSSWRLSKVEVFSLKSCHLIQIGLKLYLTIYVCSSIGASFVFCIWLKFKQTIFFSVVPRLDLLGKLVHIRWWLFSYFLNCSFWFFSKF